MTGPDLDAWLAEHGGELRSVRRRIHANPELSGEEHETTRLLCDRLVAEGLDPRPLTVGTGLVCDVGQGPGPVLALRADIDALAMDDEKATEIGRAACREGTESRGVPAAIT